MPTVKRFQCKVYFGHVLTKSTLCSIQILVSLNVSKLLLLTSHFRLIVELTSKDEFSICWWADTPSWGLVMDTKGTRLPGMAAIASPFQFKVSTLVVSLLFLTSISVEGAQWSRFKA